MREIQDMTLNVSRGIEWLERQLLERAKRFRQEFEGLETPKDAWGIRLTAGPVGDEIRIDRVFRQGGVAEEFKEWPGSISTWSIEAHRRNLLPSQIKENQLRDRVLFLVYSQE